MLLCYDCLQLFKEHFTAKELGEARGKCDNCKRKKINGTMVRISDKAPNQSGDHRSS